MNGILPCDLSKRATPGQRQIEPDGSVTIRRLEGVADEVVHPYLGGTGGDRIPTLGVYPTRSVRRRRTVMIRGSGS